jgi:simple sugar transport system permease protein
MREEKKMAEAFLNIFFLSAPLMLASFGALLSEYAGRTAVFIDGIINLSAFLCYAFTVQTKSAAAGCILSLCCCILFIFLFLKAVEHVHANPFLASLALNIFSGALVSLISVELFNTRGVLTSPFFSFPAQAARTATSGAACLIIILSIILLFTTKQGLYLRITGTDADVLVSKGINAAAGRTASWCLAAFYASCSGCVLTLRLSSFVPNISSGNGWLALAAVFLGKRTCAGTCAAVLAICTGEYFASNLQNVFPNISAPMLISLPYITALLLLFLEPKYLKE